MPAESNDSRADGAFVDPARDDALLTPGPFDGFASFAEDSHALAVAPPGEIRDAAFALDSGLGDPLACGGVEDVDHASAFASGADKAYPSAAGTELEALHASLLVWGAEDAGDFLDFARGEVPGVEVAAAAGEVDLGAGGGGEGRD